MSANTPTVFVVEDDSSFGAGTKIRTRDLLITKKQYKAFLLFHTISYSQ